ncbi:phosphoribosylformylglycinamidine synthase [Corynebacterium epidermidicanis]|uniref:Phosphoribosylformylglycinamidine synthase, clade II n=1 Tax=Corynebacterium epidermidicanis TaxID=1050174 RepID=A0A0G3GUN2_9CORY|nr:phosphoribosylformylglycinamidine synthase [Corynebacterium epidermidicanis]AKK02587.1 phosphoribosylformylglycinamidine synthase, clade II [Corynebacterium epidermidicanis]
MVQRVYVENREGGHAAALSKEYGVTVRVLNRYDVEGTSNEEFAKAVQLVLSEPQVDNTYSSLEEAGITGNVLAVEPLPGQFDQRADSAAQCIQFLFEKERPVVRTAVLYAVEGEIPEAMRKGLINPVEAREANLELPETLTMTVNQPADVEKLTGFTALSDADLPAFVAGHGLAMDADDAMLIRDYFASEDRDPTITELKVIDTYWSDHCRHTTFETVLDEITFHEPAAEAAYQDYLAARESINRTKPVTLMDMGTIAAKVLRATGKLDALDVSEEINACTVHVNITVDGKQEPWLLLFKNETHNHPTEIEPFGGAATCVGGAIRDPLSGRGYVYGAMRISGSGNPLETTTRAGKLPQKTIAQVAAAGNSSYGNQIGLATGIVDELYHPGYVAKHFEMGAVVAGAPAANVRREAPAAGDLVVFVGGATGRDGIGGATGSSKKHTVESLSTAGAEVQKGNAPEERKLQRLFRNPEFTKLIKRCNDFGAGGVSVAVGELADSLEINLDEVPKKYEGLDGTELALSESQERMAIVVEAKDADKLIELANEENLGAVIIAEVTDSGRMRMHWRGTTIVDLSRDFLNTNGAKKHARAEVSSAGDWRGAARDWARSADFKQSFLGMASDLNVASKQGLSERFDSTVGAGTVLMPFGGSRQATPIQAMANTLPVLGETTNCSVMSWGYNPYITEASPYHGAYLAVVESVAKLIATGASFDETYLSFQEYFERMSSAEAWGKPAAALLGTIKAQLGLGVAAIGGKDSMSGTFEEIHVPPTVVSVAVSHDDARNMVPNHFKAAGNKVTVLTPELGPETDTALAGLPTPESLLANFRTVTELLRSGKVISAYTPGFGGVAEAVLKMGMGEAIGFSFEDDASLYDYAYGAFVLEWAGEPEAGELLGATAEGGFTYRGETVTFEEAEAAYVGTLEPIYPNFIEQAGTTELEGVDKAAQPALTPTFGGATPKALIPVFPGTNCEYDSARALQRAGIEPEIFVVRNRTPEDIAESVDRMSAALDRSQMLFLPGGFSGGDEPDGSAKFITSFLRNPALTAGVQGLLDDRGGLILGICNGFQALIKLGLVPFGQISAPGAETPTLTFNRIGRHQSRISRVRVVNNNSPWLSKINVGDVFAVPISHGEGRITAGESQWERLKSAAVTQYVDAAGKPSMGIEANPNGALFALEGIMSEDGRVLGKMGHSERISASTYKNVPGEYDMKLFESAAEFFAK